MLRIRFAILAALTVFVGACSPAFNGRWDGSGEIGEAGFFKFSLQLDERKAAFSFDGQSSVDTVVCSVLDQDGHAEFALGTTGASSDCATLAGPLTFVGDYGQDVITGMVLDRSTDANGRLVGQFRAFRTPR